MSVDLFESIYDDYSFQLNIISEMFIILVSKVQIASERIGLSFIFDIANCWIILIDKQSRNKNLQEMRFPTF